MNKIKTNLIKIKYEILVGLLFFLVRLNDLGYDIFNTDVWKWKSRTFNFASGVFGGDFANTLQKYHPGVTLMWLGTIGIKINSIYYKIFLRINPPDNDVSSVFTLHVFQKLVIVIFLSIVIAFIFYGIKRILNIKIASIFIILLIFEPFYISLTRVQHLEGLLSTLLFGSFVYFYLYEKVQKNKLFFVFSALLCALAILTKTSALVYLPFIFIFIFYNYFKNQEKTTFLQLTLNTIKISILYGLCIIGFIFILWPALWVIPIQTINYLYSGIFETGVEDGHIQLYFGKLVDDPGFTFYLVVLLLRTSAVFVIGLIGYLYILVKKQTDSKHLFILFSILFAVLYALVMSIPSKKLDRYLLPTIIFLLPAVSTFYYTLLTKMNKFRLGIIIIISICLVRTLILHPDYLSFYNPMFGGMRVGINVIEPKWLIGQPQIMSKLQNISNEFGYTNFDPQESFETYQNTKQIENMFTVGFQEKYYTQIWPFVNYVGGRAVIKDLTAQAKNANLFVYPVWNDDSQQEDRFNIVYVDSVYLRGVELYRVYLRVE